MEQSHVMNLLVMGSDSTVPVTAANSYIDDYTDLDDGAFSVCNDENMVLSAATVLTDDRVAQTGVKLVGRYGTKLVQSDMIKAEDIITYRGVADAADVEQVTHIGYNGTTGAIQAINDNLYKLKIIFQEAGRTGQSLYNTVSVFYRSDASATATEVAFAISDLLVKDFARLPENPVVLEVLNSAAVTAANGTKNGQEVTVVKGSKYVTFETDLTYHAAGDATLVAGDLLRIGSVTAGTALTSPVYKVVSISGLVVELDRAVTNASGTYDDAGGTSDIEVIPVASIGDYGFELTGVARTHVVGKRPFSKVSFTVGLENFGTTQLVYTTPMSLGAGNPEQIADLEWFTEGNAGYKYRADYMYPSSYTSRVTAGHMYNQLCITWASKSRAESIGGPGHNPKQLIIAIDTLYDDNDANDVCIDVLDAYATISSGIGV